MVKRQVESEQIKLLQDMVLEALTKHQCNSVSEVIDILQSSNKDIKLEELYKAINDLKKNGKIDLYEPKVDSFTNYITDITSSASLWFVVGVISLALLSIYLLPQELPWSILRMIGGVLFVLFVPGYSLIQLLFKKEFDYTERVAFSIGLSIAITSLLGFILNYSVGIRLEPIVTSLSIPCLIMTLIGTYRRFLVQRYG